MTTKILVNIGSSNGLFPDGTKPILEPVLTYSQWGPLTFICGQFNMRYLRQLSRQLASNYLTFNKKNHTGTNEELMCRYVHRPICMLVCSGETQNLVSIYMIFMNAVASQITSLTIVYSSVYWDVDQRKHQSSASLAFVRSPVNSPHKGPVTRNVLPFDDVIIFLNTFSCMTGTRFPGQYIGHS